MIRLRNMSIKHKQILINLLTSTVALLLACAAFVAYDIFRFRKDLVQRTSVVAEVVGNNCVAALDFNDPKTAQEALNALRGEPHILSACIYDRNDEVFAVYERAGIHRLVLPSVKSGEHDFSRESLRLFRSIRSGADVAGTVFIETDLRELNEHLSQYPVIVGLMLGVSFVVSVLMSSRLHRLVTGPILYLTRMTRKVAEEKDYSIRVNQLTQDEIGELITGFNEMLAQIEHRETALRLARDLMEQRVQERTEDLARSLSLLNATIESTADGILAVDLSGKVVCYNKKFVAMWRVPPDVLGEGQDTTIAEFIARQVKDPEKHLARMRELAGTPEIEAFDVVELNDERVFERYVQPQRVDTQCVGRVFNYRDITRRRKGEVDLELVHAELVQISRQAGMAEVATNVLHNVGNVLNSVNTSAGLLMDHMRASTHSGVARVASLLEDNQQRLPEFLAQNGTTERIITYLKTLSEHLETEHEKMIGELRELANNIEHIKEIVAMQQSYAKVSGLVEKQSITDLMEDALRIHASALAKQQVRIVRKFDPVPDILVDKHKVLQIFVNLISNAKYALAGDHAERILTLAVQMEGDSSVAASVADNGIGIAQESLARIFSYGFTTRKNGHGFGLHSGALAAREMGGSLAVESDGPGRGARFTLMLPLQSDKGSP